MERDQSGIELAFTKDISTHTLTWSVTSVEFGALLKMLDFNSHAHVERDELVHWKYALTTHFNSHAHVERDL